jgi:hypothetical protein
MLKLAQSFWWVLQNSAEKICTALLSPKKEERVSQQNLLRRELGIELTPNEIQLLHCYNCPPRLLLGVGRENPILVLSMRQPKVQIQIVGKTRPIFDFSQFKCDKHLLIRVSFVFIAN